MTTYLDYEAEQMPIAQARAELTQLPERLSAENRTVALTRYGEPVLAVMPWDFFESLVETLEIMGDADMMDALRRGIEDVQAGNLVPIEKVKAELTAD